MTLTVYGSIVPWDPWAGRMGLLKASWKCRAIAPLRAPGFGSWCLLGWVGHRPALPHGHRHWRQIRVMTRSEIVCIHCIVLLFLVSHVRSSWWQIVKIVTVIPAVFPVPKWTSLPNLPFALAKVKECSVLWGKGWQGSMVWNNLETGFCYISSRSLISKIY